MTGYRTRALAPLVRDALADLPVVVVTGLRQAGKSTFLQQETGLATRRYVSLDDFAQLAAARSDPEAFVRVDEPVTIDEVQRCPELLLAIKREVDRARRPSAGDCDVVESCNGSSNDGFTSIATSNPITVP
jgi:predicted AAA+ superfamily ATPase